MNENSIDISALKEMQDSLSDISKTLGEIKDKLGKGLFDNLVDLSSIFGAVMAIDKVKEAFNKFLKGAPNMAKAALDGIKKLPKSIEDYAKSLGKIENQLDDNTGAMKKYDSASKKASKVKFALGGFVAVAGVIASIVGHLVGMIATNEELSEKMSKIWEKIKEAFAPVIEVVTSLFNSFASGGEGTCSMLDNIVAVIGSVAEFIGGVIQTIVTFFQENSVTIQGIVAAVWSVISTIIETAKEVFGAVFEFIGAIFEEHGDTIMAVVTTIWGFISGVLEGAKEIFGGIMDVIVGIFTGNGEKIKDGFGKIWSGIKGIFGGIGEFFSGIWDDVVKIFSKVGSKIGSAIGDSFKNIVNDALSFAESTINKFVKSINKAIRFVNDVFGTSIKTLELVAIPRMATGGLVEPGQMFIAREAGPELVGSFGSRTAVMNNNQIVEAVSRGVYSAVRSAMGSGNGAYTFNITNTLDGKEIGKQVIKYHNGVVKQTGLSPLMI